MRFFLIERCRYTALAGGAWAEVILKTFFGWRPSLSPTGVQDQHLWRSLTPRGVTGELLWLRSPGVDGQMANITLTPDGPRITTLHATSVKTDDTTMTPT